MTEAADYLGGISIGQQAKHTGRGVSYEASFILGRQIGSEPPIVILVPAGQSHHDLRRHAVSPDRRGQARQAHLGPDPDPNH
jgi:hypothetical protein